MKTYSLNIDGMTCNHCVNRVTAALRSVSGLDQATVDLASHTARVVFDESRCGMATLTEAVRAAGYSISGFQETSSSSSS